MKWRESGSGTPPQSGSLDGTGLRSALWSEVGIRGSLPIPFVARLFGGRSARLGVGIRMLQGQSFIESEGSGSIALPSPTAAIDTYTSRQGTGAAFDVGLAADLRPNLGFELGYLGAGSITWSNVQKERLTAGVSGSNVTFNSSGQQNVGSLSRELPATAYAGLRWRVFGPLELAASYARLGANLPDAVARVSGELRFNLWITRAALGVVQDEGSPSRLYAHFGLGPLTIGLYNLDEALQAGQGRNLGVAAQLAIGL